MKILLMSCLATVALTGAALADNGKIDVKPAGTAVMMTNTGSGMQMKPATAGNPGSHSTAAQGTGSMLSAWKTGGNNYGFAGNTGGCHFDGQGGTGGFKSNGGC